MKVQGKLPSTIPGIGFTVRSSNALVGELDDRGIVWIEVQSHSRIPGDASKPKRVGIPIGRFAYVEEWSPALPQTDKRAAIKEQIRAAEKAAAKGRA